MTVEYLFLVENTERRPRVAAYVSVVSQRRAVVTSEVHRAMRIASNAANEPRLINDGDCVRARHREFAALYVHAVDDERGESDDRCGRERRAHRCTCDEVGRGLREHTDRQGNWRDDRERVV